MNEILGTQEKKFHISLSKTKANIFLTLHCNNDNSYLFVNGKETHKFKASSKNVNVQSQSVCSMHLRGFFRLYFPNKIIIYFLA